MDVIQDKHINKYQDIEERLSIINCHFKGSFHIHDTLIIINKPISNFLRR